MAVAGAIRATAVSARDVATVGIVLAASYGWYQLYKVKTTVYLPERTKHRLAEAARRSGQSEAAFIRAAIEHRTDEVLPRRRGRWGTVKFGELGLAQKTDEVLADGFGEQ